MTEIIEFEEHSSVLPEWLGRELKSRTVIYLDAHLDLQQISRKRFNLLKRCQGKSDATLLEKPHFLCPDSGFSFSIEDFLFAAGSLGIIDRIVWVVPPHVEIGYSHDVLMELQQSAGVTLDDLMSFERSSDGWISGRLLGLEVSICNLHQLDKIPIPEHPLVDIDIDFFLAGPSERLWVDPQIVYQQINALAIEFELVTISRSIQSGFMPLKYRFVADYLTALFRNDVDGTCRMESLLGDDANAIRATYGERRSADACFRLSLLESDATQAKRLLQKAVDLNPNYRPCIVREISVALNCGRGPSISALRSALEEDSALSDHHRALCHAGLGLLQCRGGNIDSAIDEHSLATEFLPAHPQLALEIAQSLLRAEHPTRAEAFLHEGMADDKPRVVAQVLLAQLHTGQGNLVEAIDVLLAAVDSAPAWTAARRLLAALYQQSKDSGKAREVACECDRQERLLGTFAHRLTRTNVAGQSAGEVP